MSICFYFSLSELRSFFMLLRLGDGVPFSYQLLALQKLQPVLWLNHLVCFHLSLMEERTWKIHERIEWHYTKSWISRNSSWFILSKDFKRCIKVIQFNIFFSKDSFDLSAAINIYSDWSCFCYGINTMTKCCL